LISRPSKSRKRPLTHLDKSSGSRPAPQTEMAGWTWWKLQCSSMAVCLRCWWWPKCTIP